MIAMVIMLMKAAIIIEWIKIFVPGRTRNKFFWCAWALVGLNTGFYVAGIVSENLSCIPFQMIWDKTITDGHCINTKALDIAAASIDFVSDLAVIILPQQVIWRLQMSKKKKIGVSLLFGMGILYVIALAPRGHKVGIMQQVAETFAACALQNSVCEARNTNNLTQCFSVLGISNGCNSSIPPVSRLDF